MSRRGIASVGIKGSGEVVTLVVTGDMDTVHAIAHDLTSRMLGQISAAPPPAEQPMAEVHRSHRLGAPGPFDSQRCSLCPEVVVSANGTTPMGAAQCPIGLIAEERKALSAAELDTAVPGDHVVAGAFAEGRRTERVRWSKLDNGRWQSATTYGHQFDGEDGVSSIWLAANRQPMLDT